MVTAGFELLAVSFMFCFTMPALKQDQTTSHQPAFASWKAADKLKQTASTFSLKHGGGTKGNFSRCCTVTLLKDNFLADGILQN